MASVKVEYDSVQTLTITALNSQASSPTGAWASAVIDNTSNKYLDALIECVFDFANTAPGNSKGVYIYAYAGIESGVYSNPISGSEGDVTVPDVTANPVAFRQIGFVPYNTQDEIAEAGPFSVAQAFGGVLPPYWGIVVVNHSGAALNSSGNSIKWRGVYNSVS